MKDQTTEKDVMPQRKKRHLASPLPAQIAMIQFRADRARAMQTPTREVVRDKEFTLPEETLALLKADPEVAWKLDAIAMALQVPKNKRARNVIVQTLYRAFADGIIKATKRHRYYWGGVKA